MAHTADELLSVSAQVEAAARAGAWCWGAVAYEAAAALEADVPTQPATTALAWFAQFAAPVPQTASAEASAWATPLHWEAGQTSTAFAATLAQIHADIAAGRYYQLNLTQTYHGTSPHPSTATPCLPRCSRRSRAASAFFWTWGRRRCCRFPRIIFRLAPARPGQRQHSHPPHERHRRPGTTPAHDAAQAEHLRSSAKERAENVMIVDLLRNDLGRIAQIGSVSVPALFELQALPSVWQMTSDVRAQLPQGTALKTIFQALFPCGSITGAPKRSSMAAIAALETAPRGWYCGAAGVVRSDGAGGVRATFNVPIRTLVGARCQHRALRHWQRHHRRCPSRQRMARMGRQTGIF